MFFSGDRVQKPAIHQVGTVRFLFPNSSNQPFFVKPALTFWVFPETPGGGGGVFFLLVVVSLSFSPKDRGEMSETFLIDFDRDVLKGDNLFLGNLPFKSLCIKHSIRIWVKFGKHMTLSDHHAIYFDKNPYLPKENKNAVPFYRTENMSHSSFLWKGIIEGMGESWLAVHCWIRGFSPGYTL